MGRPDGDRGDGITRRRGQLRNIISRRWRREIRLEFVRERRHAQNSSTSWVSASEKLAGAIAIRFTLQPGEKKIVPMVIAWDFPIVEFGQGRKWNRLYTDFYGTSGNNAWAIARDALQNAAAWSSAIDAWQAPYVNDESKPLWYRSMLFNELYVLTDGGTFWGRPAGSDPKVPATFALLECFDYAYYGTLDVRFYGSMPLLKFWPQIDKQVCASSAQRLPASGPSRACGFGSRNKPAASDPQAQEERCGAARSWRARRRSIYFGQRTRLAGHQRLERSQFQIRSDGLSRLRLDRKSRQSLLARSSGRQ